jgi:diguanylate cyclase (GGDEF)-like protein
MDGAPAAVPMLLALTAAQFLVHALGWTIAARLFRRPAGPEGHFAVFWYAGALAMGVYLLPLAPGHPARALADGAVLLACLVLQRGVLLFFGRPPAHRRVLTAAVALLAALLGGLLFVDSLRLRSVGASLLVAGALAAVAASVWRHGGARWPGQALALAVPLLLLVAALLVRAIGVALADDPLQHAIGSAGLAADGFVLALFFGGGVLNLVQIRLVLGRVLERLLAQSRLDELTGVANRRGMLATLNRAYARAERAHQPFALLMVDIDHFKGINDRHGHAAGDAALVRVARLLVEGVRLGDTVARWGGEEFCVLLPRCDEEGALHLAERLRTSVAEGSAAEGEEPVTVSIGIALVDTAHETLAQTLARADRALYKAKRDGRDRVVVATTRPAPLGAA